jgi:signal peptidase I
VLGAFAVHFYGLLIYIVVDAIRFSWKGREPEASFKRPGLSVALAVVIVLLLNILPSMDPFLRWFPVPKAFVVPSASMCPTICVGERIVADMRAFKHSTPQRGDLIMLAHPSIQNLVIKRVIGLEGDLIEINERDQITVNGAELSAPELCGHPNFAANQNGEVVNFLPTKMAPRTFFVVGDNLPNSYDSRFPQFGLITSDELRARPEYIYFSHQFSRIGCKLR